MRYSNLFYEEEISILHANVRGLRSKRTELEATVRLLDPRPAILCLNETFLDRSIEEFSIPGYQCVARRDRKDGWGGVAVYAADTVARRVVLVESSEAAERCWLTLHTQMGPFLLCCWYRPPASDDSSAIESFAAEHAVHATSAVGTIVLGDLNVHHQQWLRHSSGTSAEGRALLSATQELGLQQLVRHPTRGDYLLDLVLSDIPRTKTQVLGKISDHSMVLASVPIAIPSETSVKREVWDYSAMDHELAVDLMRSQSWPNVKEAGADASAEEITRGIADVMNTAVPKKNINEKKQTHPWVNSRVLQLVAAKYAAEGTPEEDAKVAECSAGMLEEFGKYAAGVREEMKGLPRGSKKWWRRAGELMEQRRRLSSIPALQDKDGAWITDPKAKADHFAQSFTSKYVLPEAVFNDMSLLPATAQPTIDVEQLVSSVSVQKTELVLSKLDASSATGPDLVPARVLKLYAKELAPVVCDLARQIIREARWPDKWLQHWIVPLYKKKAVFKAGNYRGVHLTAQISKAVERLILPLIESVVHLSTLKPTVQAPMFPGSVNHNQFAYQRGRGARDALLLLVLAWISSLQNGKKVAVYCSDVSGAFDKVSAARLAEKLRSLGLHEQLVQLVKSWQRSRRAEVVVGGERSTEAALSNMVYQGTVLGPVLWNAFFADAAEAVRIADFNEVVFADDLNAFREFDRCTPTAHVESCLNLCQSTLHDWGKANQVSFDAAKESMHVIARSRRDIPEDLAENFRILGVLFDTRLTMAAAVHELVSEAKWRVKTIMRTHRFHDVPGLLNLYKSKVLSFIEYRTAAIYHASDEVLRPLDEVQDRLLEDLGISAVESLEHFSLAPLRTRRDIAMLGVIHRSYTKKGPRQFGEYFKVVEPGSHRMASCRRDLENWEPMKRSALGMIEVWNLLPSSAVRNCTSAQSFQRVLQHILIALARAGVEAWADCFSPRNHPEGQDSLLQRQSEGQVPS